MPFRSREVDGLLLKSLRQFATGLMKQRGNAGNVSVMAVINYKQP